MWFISLLWVNMFSPSLIWSCLMNQGEWVLRYTMLSTTHWLNDESTMLWIKWHQSLNSPVSLRRLRVQVNSIFFPPVFPMAAVTNDKDGGLKQHIFIPSQFWSSEVQIHYPRVKSLLCLVLSYMIRLLFVPEALSSRTLTVLYTVNHTGLLSVYIACQALL